MIYITLYTNKHILLLERAIPKYLFSLRPCKKTRTKTSFRYAKENDREKRERRRERERKVQGGI